MLKAHGLRVTYGDAIVLPNLDLLVERDEILCLLGPSGCGKTTLLRAIAGLEPLTAGEILLDGKTVTGEAVHERDFGLMFQEFALFPHMNVFENVRFGLRMRGERDTGRVHEVLELVGLADYARRDVTQLSGGERQRVALARSLAPNPRLLMLDEPLGALDAGLRERLMVDLRRIIKAAGLTAIYVTHDQQEAFAVADRIAVMDAGHIVQIDPPEQLYRRPGTTFVARFLGLDNLVPVQAHHGGTVTTPLGSFAVDPLPDADIKGQQLLLHNDGLYLDPQGCIEGEVTEKVFAGSSYRLRIQCGSYSLRWNIAHNAQHLPIPDPGDTVRLAVRMEARHLLPS